MSSKRKKTPFISFISSLVVVFLVILIFTNLFDNVLSSIEDDTSDEITSNKENNTKEKDENKLENEYEEEIYEKEIVVTSESSSKNNKIAKSKMINITDDYYKNHPLSIPKKNMMEQSYYWESQSLSELRYWLADWKISDRIFYRAEQDLTNLEEVSKFGVFADREYEIKYDNYFKVITDNYASPEAFWDAVYKIMRDDNEERVQIISNIFKYAINENHIEKGEAILMIIAFIQYINYQIPNNFYEILPPVNSIIENYGDCDTKSLLLAMILEDLGYDAVLFYSSEYLHALAGISIEGFGDYIEYKGKKYSIIETTAIGWIPGMVPPEVSDLRYWFPIDI